MTNLKPTGLSFSKPLTEEQKLAHKKMVEQGYSIPAKYSQKDMVVQPEDDEDWITEGYDHGHKGVN